MADQYLYLLLNVGTISVPLLCSFYSKAHFFSTWKRIIPAIFLPLVLFIVWDVAFTDMGVWGFNSDYLIGTTILNLPLEEWLFFVTIPYACLFTYFAMKHLKPIKGSWGGLLARGVGIILICVGFWFLSNWYTSVTFISLGILLISLAMLKRNYLNQFFFSYLFVLVPFFIINGVLTGSWIENEVVWYNNSENLGIRLGTIPLEDAFYGMLLLLLNTVIWEELSQKPTNIKGAQ